MSRSIDSSTLNAAKARIQTKANHNNPRLSLWISRPVTQLINTQFLEQYDVPSIDNVTDCSIATRHQHRGRGVDAVYIGYVQSGTVKVIASKSYQLMANHIFTDQSFNETGMKVSLCFDGTMPKSVDGKYQFLTEDKPWVFWISEGALYAKKLGTTETITLASANVSYVSSVRASWSEVSGFDFGLCVFFLASGALYYRQLIDGEWYDAETVPTTALPTLSSGATWTEVSASRTWDYRVALQLKASDGGLYEAYTQFMGIGSKNAEHLEIKNVDADGTLTAIEYTDASEDEHIEISNIDAGALYGGLYSIGVPTIVNAYNIGTDVVVDDETVVDYGKAAVFVFDTHLVASEVSAQASAFSIVDDNNVAYNASTATLGDDGLTVTLTFTDFNNAHGTCNAKYTAGTVTTMAGTAMETVTKSFLPTGLVPTAASAPTVTEVINI